MGFWGLAPADDSVEIGLLPCLSEVDPLSSDRSRSHFPVWLEDQFTGVKGVGLRAAHLKWAGSVEARTIRVVNIINYPRILGFLGFYAMPLWGLLPLRGQCWDQG